MSFADAFDGKAKPAVTKGEPKATPPACSFCGLGNYLNTTLHPCCYFAEAAGHTTCGGCMAFEEREKKPARRGRR